MRTKIALVILLVLSAALHAQTVTAKYAGEFLALGVGGRPAGMGGAFTALANDVTAAYYNPAGLMQINYPQVALMYDSQFGNLVSYNYAGVALPYGKDYTFAVSAMRLAVDGISDTRNALVDKLTGDVITDINNANARIDPSKVKEFSNQDWAFYLSAARRYSDRLLIGANVKFISRSIAEYSALGIGFDVGALYNATDDLVVAAIMQDVTTTLVSWNTGRNELITPTLKLGSLYSVHFLNSFVVTPAVDLDVRFENRKFASIFNVGPVSVDPHAGFELTYNKVFAVRAGYNDVKQFTLGAGVKLPKLNIDYSFARFSGNPSENLDNTHKISLILTLEEPRFAR